MIRSMTGFGRCDREVDGYRIRKMCIRDSTGYAGLVDLCD